MDVVQNFGYTLACRISFETLRQIFNLNNPIDFYKSVKSVITEQSTVKISCKLALFSKNSSNYLFSIHLQFCLQIMCLW